MVYRRLGTFYNSRDKLSEAEIYFRRSRDLAPDSPQALYDLGAVYIRMRRFSEAAEQLTKSVGIQPNGGGYTNLGAALFYQGLFEQSVEPYRHAVEILATSGHLGNLAEAYYWIPASRVQSKTTFQSAVDKLQQE